MPGEKSSTSISNTLGQRGARDFGHQGEEVEKLMEVEVRGREHNPSFTFYQAPFPPLSTQFRPIISLYVAGNIDITGLGSAPSLPVPVGNLW